MKTYPKYKDSGVEWLGEIPEHWLICKMKHKVEVKDGTHSTPTPVQFSENVYPLITTKNVKNGNLDFSDVTYISESDYIEINKRSNVENGDIIMPMIGTIGNPAIVNTERKFSIKNVALFKNSKFNDMRYIRYLFISNLITCQFDLLSTGGVQSFVSLAILKNIIIPKINFEEQKAIATYLDRKTSQIDSLIEKKKRMIELLKEERAAIINQAVTKGINPDAKMKDSGVEWLGEVPNHWQISRLKFTSNIVRGGSPRPAGSPLYFNGDHTPWITVAEITKDDNKFLFQTSEYLTEEGRKRSRFLDEGTLVLSNSGATLGVPKILKIGGCINDGSVAFLDLYETIEIDFLYYFLYSLTTVYRDFVGQGAGQPNLNTDLVKDTVIGIPPKKEQQSIVVQLERKLQEIKDTVDTTLKEISLIEEYRTALINEAVTGKIDVRIQNG